MAYLVVAVIVVAALGLVNLMLLYGVIRRLREHTELLSAKHGPAEPYQFGLAVGGEVGDFAVTTVDGVPVDRGSLAGPMLVGFFTPSCQPCREQLPMFVRRASRYPGGRDRVLAVVTAADTDAVDMVETLRTVAAVVTVDGSDAGMTQAFQVTGFPAFFLLADGVVQASEFQVSALPAMAAV